MRRLLFALLLPVAASAQDVDPANGQLHWFLQDQMAVADANEKLPVYFSMSDKLGYEQFRERILRMDKETRRETVVRALTEHMRATQHDLHEFLLGESANGNVDIISRNFLGNFIRVRAIPAVIRAGAVFEGVGYVRYDYTPPLEEVEDAAPAPTMAVPGDGPVDTRAAEVWATGITGQNVVWMNSDSGVRADNDNPSDVHPGLAGRLWVNTGEIAGNNIDDDLNGYEDDYYGWGFGSQDDDIEDNGGHGTQTAGVFVAKEHTLGDELGNCPDTRIMTARLSGEASQWEAVQYAIQMGAHGQTSSHSYKLYFNPPPDYSMHRDVAESSLSAGLIRTNSTSNDGSRCGSTSSSARKPFNISAPACVPSPWHSKDQMGNGRIGGVLGIGAHNVGSNPRTQPSYTPCGPWGWDFNDVLVNSPSFPTTQWDAVNDNDYPWAGGTQQGLLKPDLTGPTGTRTSRSSSDYGAFSGTSNATPSVSSCLALAFSANISLTPEDIAMAAKTTAIDQGPTGQDDLWGTGALDAWELTKMCRAIHRINGDVSHTVEVPSSVFDPTGYRIELDSIPNTLFWMLWGQNDGNIQLSQELTARIADPAIILSGSTDANGNFVLDVPVFPALIGLEILSQFWIVDPDFGGASFASITGSNAVRTRFVN